MLVVFPHDCVAAQHYKRVFSCVLLAWEKIKIQSTVSVEYISISHHHKVKES